MELPYERLRAVCLRAMARLARQGFVVHPSNALDVVHDFILEQWEKLSSTFDPARGDLEGLAYVAFIRFARRWVLEEQRKQWVAMDSASLDAFPATASGAAATDEAAVAAARDGLAKEDREVLDGYFTTTISLREFARRRKVSRLKARNDLAESLARLASRLHRPEGISSSDWQVVRDVWVTGLTIDESAAKGGRTREMTNAALRRAHCFFTRNFPTKAGSSRKR